MTDRIDTAALRRAHKATTQEMLDWQRDAGLTHPPTSYTLEYRKAVQGYNAEELFSLGYFWRDKPHRLVFDLCSHIEALAHEQWPALLDEIERLRRHLVHLEQEARRFAGFYEQGSDGRNTFVIFADKIAALGETMPPPPEQGQ